MLFLKQSKPNAQILIIKKKKDLLDKLLAEHYDLIYTLQVQLY